MKTFVPLIAIFAIIAIGQEASKSRIEKHYLQFSIRIVLSLIGKETDSKIDKTFFILFRRFYKIKIQVLHQV